ncbi:NB-ARC domain containing protein [Dorcoceras hygrometricum]|uniref:NB-ARC domain containing protein n=1 Tax=Dorcoceras hygrometricum TaxID=472368 RepID=A0A2Z7CMA8_9LAMI|nr:NB-ARC domain containing protein [Dorcoceras hygrometricum]
MMNSRRICPGDGLQYKQSAVGLVFMESAAGLAMETSKVESAVRNQAEAKLNQLEYNKPAGTITTSCKR